MIEFKNVNYSYKKGRGLFKKMSFQLKNGKIYGLLGLNGAGKTTALKIMAGLLNPLEGECLYDNEKTFNRHPQTMSNLFYVSDEFNLPKTNVGKYADLFSSFYPKFDLQLFVDCLKQFEIEQRDMISEMSYGQKKKVFICFGIATNANLLLMDEPTNGLDIPSKAVFRKIIAATVNEERTLIISSHQITDVEKLIDHFLIIKEGHIILDKSVNDLLEKVCFRQLKSEEYEGEILFEKQSLKGRHAVVKSNGKDATNVDVELLFEAIHSNPDLLT